MSSVGGASANNSVPHTSGIRGWNDPPDLYSMQCTNSGTSDNPFRRKPEPKSASRTNNLTIGGSSSKMSSTVPFFDPTKVQTSLSSAHMSSASNYYPNNLSMGQNARTQANISASGIQQPATHEIGCHAIGNTVTAPNYATENGHSCPLGTPSGSQQGQKELNVTSMEQQLHNIPPTQNAPSAYNGALWTENGYSSNAPLYNNFSYNSNYTQLPQQRNVPYSN